MKNKILSIEEFNGIVEGRLKSKNYSSVLDSIKGLNVNGIELFLLYRDIALMNIKHESSSWYEKHNVKYSYNRVKAKKIIDRLREKYSRDLCTDEEIKRLLSILRKLGIIKKVAGPIEGVRSTGYKIAV